ncbi:MAG: Trm112 family protein [Nitrospinota bacterium]|nr:Trm112 family protein [Nitrospinota bacterium]
MSISEDFLSVLACPICKKPLELSDDGNFLISRESKKVYRIDEGIPVLLVDEALDLEEWEGSQTK